MRDDRENNNHGERYLPVESAAHYLGVTPRSLRDLEARGIVPGYRLGRSLRFGLEELDTYLRKCRVTTLEEIESGTPSIPRGHIGPLVSPEVAAEYLGLPSVRALMQRVYRLQIPAYRISQRILRFRKSELDNCMLTSSNSILTVEDSACLPELGRR